MIASPSPVRCWPLSLVVIAMAMLAPSVPSPQRVGAAPAPSTSAPPPVESTLDSAGEDPLRYWTSDRMRNATPMDVPGVTPGARPEGTPDAPPPASVDSGFQGGAPPPSTTPEASAAEDFQGYYPYSTTVMPARAVGRIFFRAWDPANGYYDSSCSGTVVAARNRSVVWTAGHCVFETFANVWSSTFMFCPGYEDGSCPLGRWKASKTYTTQQWVDARCSAGGSCQQSEFWGDFGALVIKPKRQDRLIETRTNSHIIFYDVNAGTTESLGYPADPPFDGRWLYWCVATIFVNASQNLQIPCRATGGSSGGPWLGPWNSDGRAYVYSVNSHGGRTTMGAPFQGLWAQVLYDGVEAVNPRGPAI